MAQLPEGFSDLYSAAEEVKKLSNVIGVVTDYLPPKQTKGTDWMLTFSVDDGTVYDTFSKGQKIRMFGREQMLPPINGPGDVMLLRQVRCMEYYGQKILLSTLETQWILFHGQIPRKMPEFDAPLKQIRSKTAPNASKAEMEYVVHLSNKQNKSNFSQPLSQEIKQKMKTSVDKFSLIKDICVGQFYDIVGQVVKMYYRCDRVDLYVTDYTEHHGLYNYERQEQVANDHDYTSQASRRWEGPPGKFTLLIVLQHPHSQWARQHVGVGDYVLAQNVRIKMNYPDQKYFEGGIWQDSINPDRVKVKLVEPANDKRVQRLLETKQELGFSHILEMKEEDKEGSGCQKRKAEDQPPQNVRLSKHQKRKEKQKQAKAQKQKRSDDNERVTESSTDPGPLLSQNSSIRQALEQPNKNIRCKRIDVPERTVSEIISTLTPKFQSSQNFSTEVIVSRTTVRIVDFKPGFLEDFARPISSQSTNDTDADSSDSDSDHSASSLVLRRCQRNSTSRQRKPKYEWAFALLLEDATPLPNPTPPSTSPSIDAPASSLPSSSELIPSSIPPSPNPPTATTRGRMIAFLSNSDAEFLLNMSARNLRESGQTLAQLREKMFLLWGDLEERRSAEEEEREKERRKGVLNEGSGNRGVSDGAVVENCKTLKQKANQDRDKEIMTRPFTCCIREYGVKSSREGRDVWERRFGICDTTVMQLDGDEEKDKEKSTGANRGDKRSLRAPVAG